MAATPRASGAYNSRRIAELAGVSQATVSRVARGNPNVSPNVRQRVLQVFAETGYRPDASARSMRTGRTGIFCVSVPELGLVDTMLLAAFEAEAHKRDLNLIVWSANRPGAETVWAPSRVIDGLFLVAGHTPIIHWSGVIPSVVVNSWCDQDQADEVSGDDAASGRQIAAYFADAGRFGVCAVGHDLEEPARSRRLAGFQKGTAIHDVHLPRSRIISSKWRVHAIEEFSHLLLSATPPQAVMCTDAGSALAVTEAARQTGVRIPDDLWVVTFGTVDPVLAGSVGLTTVRPRSDAIAAKAFDALLARRANPEAVFTQTFVANEIVVAASTGHASFA